MRGRNDRDLETLLVVVDVVAQAVGENPLGGLEVVDAVDEHAGPRVAGDAANAHRNHPFRLM